MTNDTTSILVCPPYYLRVADIPSYQDECTQCNAIIAVADSSKGLLLKRPNTQILCHNCAANLIDEILKDNPDEDISIQRAELAFPMPPV